MMLLVLLGTSGLRAESVAKQQQPAAAVAAADGDSGGSSQQRLQPCMSYIPYVHSIDKRYGRRFGFLPQQRACLAHSTIMTHDGMARKLKPEIVDAAAARSAQLAGSFLLARVPPGVRIRVSKPDGWAPGSLECSASMAGVRLVGGASYIRTGLDK